MSEEFSYLRAVIDCRSLISLFQRQTHGKDQYIDIIDEIRASHLPAESRSTSVTPISDELSLVARVIIQNQMGVNIKLDNQRSGSRLLDEIRKLVFPSSCPPSPDYLAEEGNSSEDLLMDEIINHSIEGAFLCHALLISALIKSVSTSNCLAMLAWSNEQLFPIPALVEKAEVVALTNFSEAVIADVKSLRLLPDEVLLKLLQADGLNVKGGEAEVLLTLVQWMDNDDQGEKKRRELKLMQMVVDTVRTEWLTMAELEALDMHDCVVKSREATKIVASLYLGRIFNNHIGFNRVTKGPRR